MLHLSHTDSKSDKLIIYTNMFIFFENALNTYLSDNLTKSEILKNLKMVYIIWNLLSYPVL